ncbi:MAG: homocitrate synthase [Candidatus Lokiarchaeota archaeon]|nr:homocitrate synthase [Candidatus Lokiarchaeota archaeon]MBD3200155.1 homocitrate synthase [Candidatus Lokiarchaeota archaeon]
MDNRIYIIDVTNRDGVQTSRLGLAKLEKTVLNVLLNRMGIFQSEMGFPTTLHETNYINANLELAQMGVIEPMRLGGWVRAIEQDVEKAVELTRIEHLNLSISTSHQMIEGKFQGKFDENDIIELMVKAVIRARELGIKSIGVNAEDASRSSMDYLKKFGNAARKAGADRFRYCDTLGYERSFRTHFRCKDLARELEMPIELHTHNDLGMAVANAIEGAKGVVEEGQDAYINTTVNGMGERSGNADLVSTLLALEYAADFSELGLLDPNLDLSKAWQIAKYAEHCFGVPITVNQVGVGANAFAHESGIHADGMLKNRRNYELYDPEVLGRGEKVLVETGRMITTGEYSGISAFEHVYDNFNLKFKNDEEARQILELVRFANVHKQRPLLKEEFIFIANYPRIAETLLTMVPPKITIFRPYIEHKTESAEKDTDALKQQPKQLP